MATKLEHYCRTRKEIINTGACVLCWWKGIAAPDNLKARFINLQHCKEYNLRAFRREAIQRQVDSKVKERCFDHSTTTVMS